MLLKWKGYDKRQATWVKEVDINDPQPIERYFKLKTARHQLQHQHPARVNMLWMNQDAVGTYRRGQQLPKMQ
jgi:hypothetical protein